MKEISTQCCISGGGPAGIMLGYLLARSGVEVTVLEKWPDFFRDFRGDTIHPSTLAMLQDLGLLEKFLTLPYNKTEKITVHIEGKETPFADFTKLKNVPKYIAFVPQWDFLNFIAEEGKQYSGFNLLMETEVVDIIKQDGKVCGVLAKSGEEELKINADLVVGADGRHSTIREKAGLELIDLKAPIDVLWFGLPQTVSDIHISLGYISKGQMMVLIDRDTYWQCAYLLGKGDFEKIKAEGIEAFREKILKVVPHLETVVSEIKSFDDVKLLSVTVDYLKRWYLPNLICIGDSAHAMSPVGGVGINLAIQDAIAAANILAPAFKSADGVQLKDLEAIEKRRTMPARVIQKGQVFIHNHILLAILSSVNDLKIPWQLKLLKTFPFLQRLPAWIIGVGVRPEYVSSNIKITNNTF